MKTKIFGLLMAIVMVLGLMVACGGDDTDNGSNNNSGDNNKPSHTHSYVDGECSCGEKDPNYVPPHEHTPGTAVQENVVNATCKAAGSYDEVVKCSSCGNEISRTQKVIEKLAHTEVTLEAVEATCTATGLTAGKKCSVCDEVIEAQTVVEKVAHNYVDGTCSACGAEDPDNEESHEHTPGEAVQENVEEATSCFEPGSCDKVVYCTVCGEELSRETGVELIMPHEYEDGFCTMCGDEDPNFGECEHEFEDGYCTICGEEDPNFGGCEHNYVDGYCEFCGEIDPSIDDGDDNGYHIEGIYWKTTPINYELNEASDSGQFTSGVKRYYAGASADSTDLIDVDIRDRNKKAESTTNVKINYSYLEDIPSNDWARNVETIANNTKTYTAGKSIDVYCNFVYDLGCAAVKGCFASLKANTSVSSAKYGTGLNFFRFNAADYNPTSDNYFDSYSGEGYFYEYMRSLTLSDNKMYLLGSDYCTDLVRAFHVVPVHVELMNSIKEDMLPEFEEVDYDENLSNIEYFYEGVWAGEWTYDTLLNFSEAVYQNSATGAPNADITDTLGFAISGGGGLPASGILYTSSVQIINKEKLTAERRAELLAADANNAKYMADDYYITYPETNEQFVEYATALDKLFKKGASRGICVVDEKSSMASIRNSFVAGKMLFGSIIALGSLEDLDYQTLRAGQGFGIVPVPVYKAGEEYRTFVHNNARVIAIAKLTNRFEQISAFLDYQSRHSSKILESYYNNQLAQSLDGDVGGDNEQMLIYIRNHVRNVFDKTYEDVMGDFNKKTDAAADLRRWHEILRINKFQISNMGTVYEENKDEKAKDLVNVINAWNALQ